MPMKSIYLLVRQLDALRLTISLSSVDFLARLLDGLEDCLVGEGIC